MDQNALADGDPGHSLLPRPVSTGRYLTMHSRGAEVTEILQRARLAPRRGAAQRFRMGDEERMVLLEHAEVSRQARLEMPLHVVVVAGVEEADPPSDPDRVRVDQEDGMAARVEEDRIGGLRAHTCLREQVLAHRLERAIEVSAQISPRASEKVETEISEPRRLRPVQARHLNVLPNDGGRGGSGRSHVEEAGRLQ